MTTPRILSGLLLAGLALTVAQHGRAAPRQQASGPDEQKHSVNSQRAARYATAFFTEDQEGMDALHDATMRGAMNVTNATATRAALASQLGAFESLGKAWHADDVQGYSRYRVPARFERDQADLLVVIDTDGAVAGFSVVPFVEQLLEEPEAPGQEEDFLVGEVDEGLPGTLLLPEGEGPFPAIVLLHGSGPSDRDGTLGPNKTLRDIAWGLARHGVASLRYEKRSKHDVASLLAHGDAMTLVHEVLADAQIAVRSIRSHDQIQADQVYVVGHSLGGAAAPRVAQMDEPPAGVVVLAGVALPFAAKMVEQTEYIVNTDGVVTNQEQQHLATVQRIAQQIEEGLADPSSAPLGYLFGAPIGYYRDLEANPPPTIARESKLPIFVVQGDRDYQVTLDDFAVWEEALSGNGFACLARYPKLDHHFHVGEGPSTPEDYQRRAAVAEHLIVDIADWIKTRQCPER